MSTKISTRCPGCHATLNIPTQHCGKKVVCPKCQTQFKVPMPNDEANFQFATKAVPAPSAPPREADPFADFADLNSYAPVSSAPAYQSQAAATPTKAKAPAKQKAGHKSGSRREREMTESDQSLQGSGFFLLVLPVLASALPLMDLQIARLAALGEFAPLAAMFLAFIGAGMIAYARRGRSDGPVYAGLAALFSLVVGLGGFGLLFYLSVKDAPVNTPQLASADNSRIGSAPPANFNSQSSIPPTRRARRLTEPNIPSGNIPSGNIPSGNIPSGNVPSGNVPSGNVPSEIPRPNIAQPAPASASQQTPVNSSNDNPTAEENPFVEEEPNPRTSEFDRPDFSNSAPNPFANLPERPSPIADNKNENGLPDAISNFELIKKNGEARAAYMRAFSQIRSAKNNFVLKNLVGEKSNMGALYAQDKAETIGVFNHHGGLLIIPMSSNEKPDLTQDNIIQTAKGETLAGLRFAFSEGKIVGVQGLIKQADAKEPSPTKWIGVESDEIKESLNPDPNKARMVVFQKLSAPIGFAWAIEK